VAKFLERIGDSILNIGETTLFILTGERLKLHQYLHLEQLVGPVAATPGQTATVDVRQIWGGVSGARVGRIDVGAGRRLIWKEGEVGDFELRAEFRIVGGNSGSPVINAKGELVGLIFDGNIQSLPAYFVYDSTDNRAVSVDVRGMVEALRKVYGAEALVSELLASVATPTAKP